MKPDAQPQTEQDAIPAASDRVARLEIGHLRKVYNNGVVALDDFSLSIGNGVLGLLGPNGAGKTTLMEILSTLLLPTSGRASFDGIDLVRKPDRIRRLLGYLPQIYGLYPNLTVAQFLRMMGRLHSLSGARLRRRVDEALDMVDLGRLRRRSLKALSGGERRRVGIAQALLNDPSLLIVDEPTSGLDPQERLRFRNLLYDLGQGRVVILSTHIVTDIEFSCSDMVVLHHGRILYRGAPSALIAEASGKTWEFRVSPEEFERVRDSFGLVGILEGERGSFRARVVSNDRPTPDAAPVDPNLEDAYILRVGAEGRV